MSFISKINKRISKSKSLFELDLKSQLHYMNQLPNPKNLIERSYLQYKCQSYQKSIHTIIINNALSLVAIIPVVFYLLIKSILHKRSAIEKQHYEAVFIFAGVENIVPLSLKQKYSNFIEVDFNKMRFLKLDDLKVFFKLRKYFFSPFFLMKSIYKIAMYRAIIDEYKPEAIICSSEYSFTSSLLTWYCEQHGIKHINVMHGEKLLNIRESFFQFHKCYVWDNHYIELFKLLRAAENQFIVDTPPSLFIKKTDNFEPKYELTYYLAGESISELLKIKNILEKIKIPNHLICLRAHPRYSDLKQIKSVFYSFAIEDPKSCSIKDSFNNTKIIGSLYSTVLYQGYISGKQIVVDDLSQKEKYNKLIELKFIVLSKSHFKLSEYIKASNKQTIDDENTSVPFVHYD